MADTLIECFGLQLCGDQLVGRRVEVPLGGDPDREAAAAIGLDDSELDGIAVLHSTSWRWDREAGALVLTYLCCPDPRGHAHATAGTPSGDLVVIARPESLLGTPSRPSPAEHAHGTVLHHGVGHLAWLAEHEPHLVAGSVKAWPELWDAVLASGRSRAGQLVQPHRLGSPPDAAEATTQG